jgi:hypothetical protein
LVWLVTLTAVLSLRAVSCIVVSTAVAEVVVAPVREVLVVFFFGVGVAYCYGVHLVSAMPALLPHPMRVGIRVLPRLVTYVG